MSLFAELKRRNVFRVLPIVYDGSAIHCHVMVCLESGA
jgi:hypothetical protein